MKRRRKRLDAFVILKALVDRRKLSLREVKQMIPVRFGDHRDWLPVASLVDGGYIHTDLQEGGSMNVHRNDQVAITLFTMTFGPGEHEYQGRPLINGGDFNDEVHLICAAKGDLWFEELRSKRRDRAFQVLLGLVIASATAWATQEFSAGVDNPSPSRALPSQISRVSPAYRVQRTPTAPSPGTPRPIVSRR
jgi:hypothetical protein